MAIIWVHVPLFHNDKLKVWLDENWHVQVKWIAIEVVNDRLYVDGELANFENPEKLIGNKELERLDRGAQWFSKIAIFENEEDKMKFILRWL